MVTTERCQLLLFCFVIGLSAALHRSRFYENGTDTFGNSILDGFKLIVWIAEIHKNTLKVGSFYLKALFSYIFKLIDILKQLIKYIVKHTKFR